VRWSWWRTQMTSTSGPAERSRAGRAQGSPWRTSCSAGLTVTELLVATGGQKTWVYDRLAELQQAALVERAGQGRYRLRRPPTGGREAVS
jgi:hypothetical protein